MKVELILSIVLASSTVLYTIINLMMWYESRATRKQKNTPLIIAYLRITEDNKALSFRIKNNGEGHAENVKISFIKDFNQFNNPNLPLSEIGIAENGYNIFPPQHELIYYIDSVSNLGETKNDLESKCIELEITYRNHKGRRIKNKYNLPFIQIWGQNHSDPPETYLGQIPYYLKDISNTIKNKSFNNINI